MAQRLMGLFAAGAALLQPALADNTLILPPPSGKAGDPAAWVVLPGAQIDKSAYQPLAEAAQKAASMPLWVGVLGTYLAPTALPPEIGPRIDVLLSDMEKQGLDLKKVKLFYGGHSLGSVFIQDHLLKNHGPSGPKGGSIEVVGQVLMGGFLQRKYTQPALEYPVTTLTVGGELDGLARPTRLAEAFYASQVKGSAEAQKAFPVIILPGMTHMQFASGEPPLLVKARDLEPEVSLEKAHAEVGGAVADYFEQVVGISSGQVLANLHAKTAQFVGPIIAAYEMEGARYFNVPVQFGGPQESKCVVGNDKGACPSSCPWAPEGQRELSGGIDGWSLNLTNQFVSLSSTPIGGGAFHLPEIRGDEQTKTISISTFTQAYWDDAQPSWFDWKEIFDNFDTGFVATSALELGTKLASRQCTYIQGTGAKDTSFSVDDPNFCARTNQKAYEWAKSKAAPPTAARFERYGQKFAFGADVPKQGGPLWLYARLQFNEKVPSDGGEAVVEVASPMQKTEIDYWTKHFGPIPRPSFLPDPGCYHYCKLLSPARAMEWIYVDSLRAKRGLSAGPSSQSAIVV